MIVFLQMIEFVFYIYIIGVSISYIFYLVLARFGINLTWCIDFKLDDNVSAKNIIENSFAWPSLVICLLVTVFAKTCQFIVNKLFIKPTNYILEKLIRRKETKDV